MRQVSNTLASSCTTQSVQSQLALDQILLAFPTNSRASPFVSKFHQSNLSAVHQCNDTLADPTGECPTGNSSSIATTTKSVVLLPLLQAKQKGSCTLHLLIKKADSKGLQGSPSSLNLPPSQFYFAFLIKLKFSNFPFITINESRACLRCLYIPCLYSERLSIPLFS